MSRAEESEEPTYPTDEETIFSENGGLYTVANLSQLCGSSSVTVWTSDDLAVLRFWLTAGSVGVDLTPERADELGDALKQAAAELRDGQEE